MANDFFFLTLNSNQSQFQSQIIIELWHKLRGLNLFVFMSVWVYGETDNWLIYFTISFDGLHFFQWIILLYFIFLMSRNREQTYALKSFKVHL